MQLSDRDISAIRAAGTSTRDVDLAWRYGVGASAIARIRAVGVVLVGQAAS